MLAERPLKTMVHRPVMLWTGLAAAAAFAVLYILTVAESTADTPLYVTQILEYQQKSPAASPLLLWEFGHLLWRPLGYGLWRVLQPVLLSWSGGNPSIEITLVLLALNFLIGVALTILLLLLCRRLGLAGPTALCVTAGFILFSSVLNYVHSGMSYNLGFTLQIAALLILLSIEQASRRGLFALAGGVAMALSFAVWFPFVLTVPSILLAAWLANPPEVKASPNSQRARQRLILIAAFAAAVAGFVLFAAGALINHFHSYEAIKQWVVNSAHGVAPENRLVRLPTGITRSFLYFSDQGVVLKRFVLGDPYAPVHLADLFPALWRVLVVFLALAFVLLALARNKRGWPALAILLSGLVPVIAFAVLLFETSEPARYEPAYPALLVAVCALLLLPEGGKSYQRFLGAFLAVMAIVNLSAYGWTLRSIASEASERAALVHDHAAPRGIAFLLSFRDPLSKFVQKSPLSPMNRQGALPFFHVFEPGTARMGTWKQDAACRILQAWSDGGEAWLSDRLAADRPRPEWEWVERDDSRLHWEDVPRFFLQFDKDGHVGTDDGFFRVAGTAKNREQLRILCAGSIPK